MRHEKKLSSNGTMAVIASPNLVGQEQLQDKVALVIGGESQNGRSLASSLAKKGAHIIIVCLHDVPPEAYGLQQHVMRIGRRCLLIAGDPTNRSFAQQVTREINTRFGRLDIFIDCSEWQEGLITDEHLVFPNFALMKAALQQIAA